MRDVTQLRGGDVGADGIQPAGRVNDAQSMGAHLVDVNAVDLAVENISGGVRAAQVTPLDRSRRDSGLAGRCRGGLALVGEEYPDLEGILGEHGLRDLDLGLAVKAPRLEEGTDRYECAEGNRQHARYRE